MRIAKHRRADIGAVPRSPHFYASGNTSLFSSPYGNRALQICMCIVCKETLTGENRNVNHTKTVDADGTLSYPVMHKHDKRTQSLSYGVRNSSVRDKPNTAEKGYLLYPPTLYSSFPHDIGLAPLFFFPKFAIIPRLVHLFIYGQQTFS